MAFKSSSFRHRSRVALLPSGLFAAIASAALLSLPSRSDAGDTPATPPSLLQVFDESLAPGAKWDVANVASLVDANGGYSGTRWAHLPRDSQTSISGLTVKIRENPAAGEYRYLTFAWRKWGGGQLGLRVDRSTAVAAGESKGDQVNFTYDAGSGAPVGGKALRVADASPDRWTVVTRDLWQDFGDVTISGLTAINVGGRDAGLDHVYLAKTKADFDNALITQEQVEAGTRQLTNEAAMPTEMAPATPPPPVPTTPAAEAPATDVPAADAPADTNHAVAWGGKLKEAGWDGLLQLALSIFGAIFVFERLINLRQKNLVPKGVAADARRLWDAGRFEELERLAETRPSTLTRVIAFVVANRHASLSEVSEIAGDIVSREIDIQNRKAYPLGVVASLAPLLGLFGMILGMIETFEVVSMAGSLGDPSQLAGGISKALVTTALGLAIAIPFLALYHVFKHRTAGYAVQLEEQVTTLLSAWFIRQDRSEKGHTHAGQKEGRRAVRDHADSDDRLHAGHHHLLSGRNDPEDA